MYSMHVDAVLPHRVAPFGYLRIITPICGSPKLFAACRVLHRLLMPRHSPCALLSFTYSAIAVELCRLNRFLTKLYTLKKSSFCLQRTLVRPSVALLCLLFCSVFKVHVEGTGIPSKLNNVRPKKSDLESAGSLTGMSP